MSDIANAFAVEPQWRCARLHRYVRSGARAGHRTGAASMERGLFTPGRVRPRRRPGKTAVPLGRCTKDHHDTVPISVREISSRDGECPTKAVKTRMRDRPEDDRERILGEVVGGRNCRFSQVAAGRNFSCRTSAIGSTNGESAVDAECDQCRRVCVGCGRDHMVKARELTHEQSANTSTTNACHWLDIGANHLLEGLFVHRHVRPGANLRRNCQDSEGLSRSTRSRCTSHLSTRHPRSRSGEARRAELAAPAPAWDRTCRSPSRAHSG
jgi:hypothetical protein